VPPPCAPFLPAIAKKAGGDLGFTAAFMLLTATGTVAFMPFAVPLSIEGWTVSAWTIARPLLIVVLLPLAVGRATLRASPSLAAAVQGLGQDVQGLPVRIQGEEARRLLHCRGRRVLEAGRAPRRDPPPVLESGATREPRSVTAAPAASHLLRILRETSR